LSSSRLQAAEPATVDIIIVNWNGGEEVLTAVRSAIAFGGTPIVVDNGSTDGSADRLAIAFPEAVLHRMGKNTGFSRACNVGVSSGSGQYIMLLNPDAEVIHGSIGSLVRAFASDPQAAIVGPQTVDAEGNRQTSVRRFPTLLVLYMYQFKLHRFARWIRPMRDYFMTDFKGDQPVHVDQVIGAAFAMRRQDWEDFGGLDEGYFLLFEEVDLSRRVCAAGRTSLYWPHVVVRHSGGTSFRKLSRLRLQQIWNASLLRYVRIHMGLPAAAILCSTIPLTLLIGSLRDLSSAIRSRMPHSDSSIRG
jgi:GT2 family glycosyltransferase